MSFTSYALRRASSECKIIVTKLPWTIGTNELREHFTKFGALQSCMVLFNKTTGFSRKTGILKYKDENSYNEALAGEHELDGKAVRLEPAREESFQPRRTPNFNRASLRRNVDNIMDSI